MEELASFGSSLRRWRKARDLSQAELAARSGCAEDTIRKLEAEARRPSRQLAERLADELALPPDERRAFVQAARGTLALDRLDLPPLPATSEVAREALPGGTLTFLFSDIEGSTQLWEQHKEAMSTALARHDAMVRQAVACQHGTVFKTVGDGVHAIFARAADALAAALTAQRALLDEAWEASGLPAGQPLRVRMALHSGAAELREGDYYGPPINRLARLLAAAHGNQILLSRAGAELVADGLPAGVSVRDLGTHQLSGLGRPEQIFQLVGPGLPCEFPPLRSVAPPSTNAPAPALALLTTKLYMPPARANLVSRPRLIARLHAGMTSKLTLLAAPAGFGKTTLLSQACGAPGAELGELATPPSPQPPSAWVALDAGDNDPTRFWSYVCAALETLLPGVAETALALLQSPQPPPAQTLLTSLLNALSARAAECMLVLDDYHVIEEAAIHDALAFLLERLPARLHLVLASRTDPPLPLARLRARGELSELRAAELRFTSEEASTFLTEVMDLPLSPAEVAALERRTEGWIAGLQLTALSMRERHDRAGFIRAFTGSNRFVGEYLADEVFTRQPPHIQTFLLQTSILDRMCGRLCDAVLLGGAGRGALHAPDRTAPTASFSQVLLEELERANVFVVPLDDQRQWYRYHHLFGEMLRARLLRGASEVEIATLHRRASAWYERQGLVVEAVQHALAAREWEPAARLIKDHGMLLTQSGQVHTVLGWLDALPAAVVQLSPTLCLVHALGLMFTNQFDAAEGRLHDAERALEPETPADRARRVRGNVAMMRGGIRYFTGDLAQAISLMQQALELLPKPTTSEAAEAPIARARAVAALFAATAYQLTGDVSEASERRAADVIAPARATGYLTEMLRSHTALAYLQVLQGRLRAAAATYAAVERLVPDQTALHALIGGPSYYFGMGDLQREWNQLEEADGELARGRELAQEGLENDADAIRRGYLALARLLQARGDGEAALATLDAFIQLARERKFFHLMIDQAAALRARLQLLQGDLPAALRWVEGSGLTPDDQISFLREAAQLTLVRVRIAAGQAADVLPLLSRLLADAEEKARVHSAIEILNVQALAYQALADRPRALSALECALALAAPEGYIRMFVDEGAPMRILLAAYSGQLAARERTGGEPGATRLLAYVERLLAAFPRTEGRGPRTESAAAPHSVLNPQSSTLVEPLSERELQVLTLIAEGHSNQQIAEALIVSVGTVKKHLNNIFGKLGVESRTQAVARARALHLL
jgi:LuxR family maltose regulon positive regulatory protein